MDYAFDLGSYSRCINCASQEAQTWFDRGLIWTYGFNHEEASQCFQKAITADPNCAMAYWGLAYVKGPFINKTWDLFADQEREVSLSECHALSQKAVMLSAECSKAEQSLIYALAQRYCYTRVNSLEELYLCNDNYANAMRKAHTCFPEDLDIIALFAEAMMLRTPWCLWDIQKGVPQEGADTLEIIEVLEKGLALDLSHVGVLHIYIHALEMSPYPEKALKAADALRDLSPDAGHLLHMPAHIDVLCGYYSDAVKAGRRSTLADAKYLQKVGPYGFYATACCHDFHLMMFAAMLMGNFQVAQEAAEGIKNIVTEDVLVKADTPYLALTLENYLAMNTHLLVRFGKWDEIIALAAPSKPELFKLSSSMHYYAKGLALAAKGQLAAALKAQEEFELASKQISSERHLFNNKALTVLEVGRAMLKGELEYRRGAFEKAFVFLREAVQLNDNLAYTEPWAWMHPPRHALAALLLEQGQLEEAEQVCRADLGLDDSLCRPSWHPNNVWMLHAYHECLERLGKTHELPSVRLQLQLAQARTDIAINSSCCCRHQPMPQAKAERNGCCHE